MLPPTEEQTDAVAEPRNRPKTYIFSLDVGCCPCICMVLVLRNCAF